jgi:hypothetical protein
MCGSELRPATTVRYGSDSSRQTERNVVRNQTDPLVEQSNRNSALGFPYQQVPGSGRISAPTPSRSSGGEEGDGRGRSRAEEPVDGGGGVLGGSAGVRRRRVRSARRPRGEGKGRTKRIGFARAGRQGGCRAFEREGILDIYFIFWVQFERKKK